jgi:hypothetical protein
MTMIIYTAIAIAFLLSVLGLIRKTRSQESDEFIPDRHSAPSIGNRRWLDLSDRIFDPSDARWLAEELAFPKLAKSLSLERRKLAIHWLETLQASFDEVVRTPELDPGEAPAASSAGSWRMLWLTLRFKFLVSYALLMVKLFGPYHRLIPSFSWLPFSRESEPRFRRAALANNRSSH